MTLTRFVFNLFHNWGIPWKPWKRIYLTHLIWRAIFCLAKSTCLPHSSHLWKDLLSVEMFLNLLTLGCFLINRLAPFSAVVSLLSLWVNEVVMLRQYSLISKADISCTVLNNQARFKTKCLHKRHCTRRVYDFIFNYIMNKIIRETSKFFQ